MHAVSLPTGRSRRGPTESRVPSADPEIRIRPFVPSDYSAIVELWRISGIHLSPSDTPRELERSRRRDPDLFLVAERDGRIVGAVLGRFDGRRGWINHLAVDAAMRHLGLGARLMTEVERRLARKGCAKVNLHVTRENEAVCAFYERVGYARRDMVFMEKWLRVPAPGRV